MGIHKAKASENTVYLLGIKKIGWEKSLRRFFRESNFKIYDQQDQLLKLFYSLERISEDFAPTSV